MSTQTHSVSLVDPNLIADEVRLPTMRRVVKLVAKHAKRTAPRGTRKLELVKTGKRAGKKRRHLYQTIKNRVLRKGQTGAVYATSPHAHLVHGGTRPHEIRTKHSKAIVIGGHVIGGKVRHPGAKAQPFLTEAAEASRAEVASVLKDVV